MDGREEKNLSWLRTCVWCELGLASPREVSPRPNPDSFMALVSHDLCQVFGAAVFASPGHDAGEDHEVEDASLEAVLHAHLGHEDGHVGPSVEQVDDRDERGDLHEGPNDHGLPLQAELVEHVQ